MKLILSSLFMLAVSVTAAAATEDITPGIRGHAAELQRELKNPNKPVNEPNGRAIGWWCCKPLSVEQCEDWQEYASEECDARRAGSNFQGCKKNGNKCEEIKG